MWREWEKVLDVGSYDVNGSYKRLFDGMDIQYVGLDITNGPNVDVVMDSPYSWDSLEDEGFDYIISGQAFEHIEFPWLTIKEIFKKLKWGGIICIIAPNSTQEHRFPLDCYRYFGDGLAALAKWGGFTVLDVSVAGIPKVDVCEEWDSSHNDACLIAIKGSKDLLGREIVKFPYERRYNKALDLELQYDFLFEWIHTADKQLILQSYIARYHVKTVYIDTKQGNLGILLFNELRKINQIKVAVLDEINTETELNISDDHSLVIKTRLDFHRSLCNQNIRKDVPAFYIDDMFCLYKISDFYRNYENVYVYGAGTYAKRLIQCMRRHKMQPCGVIVSRGRRKEPLCENIKVYEIQEVAGSGYTGIIIAVKNIDDRNEIAASLAVHNKYAILRED